jgi:acyl-CoA thioesterase
MHDDVDGRRADRGFLGLEFDEGATHGQVVVHDRLLTPARRFFGGAGVAIATAAMEAATGRGLRWVTTQFVSSARAGDTIEVVVDVGATGRTTSQAHVVATVSGRTLFHALGATDVAPGDVPSGAFADMPEVVEPAACPPLAVPFPAHAPLGHFVTTELLDAGSGPSGAMNVWARLRDHDPARPAMLGFIADYVPLSVMRALREVGAGTSLDNTIRIGGRPANASPWVLLEIFPDLAADGFGHGTARLWSAAGELLGVATQTMRLKRFPG